MTISEKKIHDEIIPLKNVTKVLSRDLDENITFMSKELAADSNFDINMRTMEIGKKKAILYFINGFTQEDMVQKMMQYLLGLKEDAIPSDEKEFAKKCFPYGDVETSDQMKTLILRVLSGYTCLIVDGYSIGIIMDCRSYPDRSVEEPEKDKVMRGSRDGFVETIVSNTALIRRRIRDPRLAVEMLQAGERSCTDIAICYMKDLADQTILNQIRQKIEHLQVDSLTMNQESLAEVLFPYKWYNPFPKYRFCERPDAAAASILEGSIVVLVDNSPAAMILPSSFLDLVEEANDFYFPPITGTYLRMTRILAILLTVFLVPLFLLCTQYPDYLADELQFIVVEKGNLPLWLQFLLLEFSIDGLKLAAVNTPNMLSTPLSIIAGLVLGEYAVESGWFIPEVMLYMAVVVVANYSQSSFEFGYALKFFRIQLMLLTAWFSVVGFLIGIAVIIIAFVKNKTLVKTDLWYPLKPITIRKIEKAFIRGRKNNR